MLPEFPIAEIVWLDFTTAGGWHTRLEVQEFIDKPEEEFVYISVGYLVDKNFDRLILAAGVAPNGDMCDLTRIPVSQVKEVRIHRDLPGTFTDEI